MGLGQPRPGENCVWSFPVITGNGVIDLLGHVAVFRTKDPRKGYLIQDQAASAAATDVPSGSAR